MPNKKSDYRPAPKRDPTLTLGDIFGVRSTRQVLSDLGHVLSHLGRGFQVDTTSLGHLRPDLSLPAYARRVPRDGAVPIMNLFDRVGGGRQYTQRVTKKRARDFRGLRHTYDEHDGVDFVCPPGTPIVAAAPGSIAMIRDRWLRGGLTMAVDHGGAVTTQYTHLSRALLPEGARVHRGQVIGLSGAAGLEMLLFCPWVPPHLHFMTWYRGQPIDPFLGDDESRRTAVWECRNAPTAPAEPDGEFAESRIDTGAATDLLARCRDPALAQELSQLSGQPVALAALLEDSLHHERQAWPDRPKPESLRFDIDTPVRLSLPLDPLLYTSAYIADR